VGRSVGTDLVDILDGGVERTGLTGRLNATVEGIPPVWRRRIGGGVIAGIGALLVAVPLYHFHLHSAAVEVLLGDRLPLLFGLILAGTASGSAGCTTTTWRRW